MSQVIQTSAMPSVMEVKLRAIRRRQVALAAAWALMIGTSTLLAAMIVAMILDWAFTLFHPGARAALTTGTLMLAAVALWISGAGPLIAALGWTRAAETAEEAAPQLEERWTTVANFATGNHWPSSPAAQAMLKQVEREAAALGKLVEPRQAVRPVTLRPAMLTLLACSATLGSFLVLGGIQSSVLLRRFWSPWANITATQLGSLTGDVIIPRGESLELAARWEGVARSAATLTIEHESGVMDVFALEPDANRPGTFAHSLRVEDSFRYRVRAGDGQTAWHRVTAIDYPKLGEVRFTITTPEYVNREPLEKSYIPRRVSVVEGSRLVLLMKPQSDVQRLQLTLSWAAEGDDTPAPADRVVAVEPDTDGWYRFESWLLEDFSLSPSLVNEHGLTNQEKHVCRVQVLADQAPVARIISPLEERAVAVDEEIEIRFEAHDDHGIATAELVVYDELSDEGQEPTIVSVQNIPLADQHLAKHVTATTRLDLKLLNLEPGANVSYAIRVTDNRNAAFDRPSAAESNSVNSSEETDPQTQSASRSAGAAASEDPGNGDTEDHAGRDLSDDPHDKRDRDRESIALAREDTGNTPEPTESPSRNQASESATADDDESDGGESNETVPEQETTDPRDDTAPVAGNGRSARQSSSRPAALDPQQATSGQHAETSRRRLKITERLTSVARAEGRAAEISDLRGRIVQIDRMLGAVEADLTRVVSREIPSAARGEALLALDVQLGDVEQSIAELHHDTREGELAFAGLQMVDIGRSRVTPARDRVFVAIRNPANVEAYAGDALQHVVRARELLAAFLERYDRVVRELELAQAIEETATMYEVYVQKMQRLMREARQNTNPLERKMALIEVDQEYLDRYAEVLTLRREMLAEFARMLADDPRLMARYLDLIKRRRNSLRDQLSQLALRQDELAGELSGWLQVDEAQSEDLWRLLVELRLQATTNLARDAAELAERIEKQAPLVLEPSQGTAAAVIGHAQEIARLARSISLDASRRMQAVGPPNARTLTPVAEQLVAEFTRLEAALDLLVFENENDEEVTAYVGGRLLESRTVADLAVAWAAVARHLEEKQFAGLAQVDQNDLADATELLRVQLLGIEQDLDGQFQQQTASGTPEEILHLVHALHHALEAVVFHQAAATFALTTNQLDGAELQQAKALERFQLAEDLFDRIRRDVADALDEYDVPDPNIADLLDPTLDEFLTQLEREPDLEAQLGIPARPRNLRVLADTLLWQQAGGEMLGESGEAAMQRARQAMQAKQRLTDGEEDPRETHVSEERREQMEMEKEMQDMLARSLATIEEKLKDSSLTPQERRQLEQMAENLRGMQDQLQEHAQAMQSWDELAESDQAKATLRALARGEAIPDQQWNTLLSTLEVGLWQVRGRTPPADYRKAIEQYQDRLRQRFDFEE